MSVDDSHYKFSSIIVSAYHFITAASKDSSFPVLMSFLYPTLPLLEDAASIQYEAANFSSFFLFFLMSETMCLFTPYFSQTLFTVAPFSMSLMSYSFFTTDKFTRLRFTDLLILLLILDKTQNFLDK